MARKHHFEDTAVWKFRDLDLTFQGDPISKVIKGNGGSHMTTLSVDNRNYVARKHQFEDTAVWKDIDLDLTFEGHSRSKVTRGNEIWHMTS